LVAGALLGPAAAAQAATKPVYAGPPPRGSLPDAPRYAVANKFYPRTITVAEGDSVRYRFRGFHTVLFRARGQNAPPLIVPDPSRPAAATDAAGAAFWFNGQPKLIFNPQVVAAAGDATVGDDADLHNSGIFFGEGPPPDYRVTFPDSGSYEYLCSIHPGMQGRVRVVEDDDDVPSRAEDERRYRRQLRSDARLAERLDRYNGPRGLAVQAGNDRRGIALLKFYPARKRIRVGQTVRFRIASRSDEVHTFSFGPRAYLTELVNAQIQPEGGSAGAPPTLVLDPRVTYPSDPPPTLPPFDGTNHGNGFISTGLLDAEPGGLPGGGSIRFTRAGNYRFICLIHPEMRGLIQVR
jgi:plastocyanin